MNTRNSQVDPNILFQQAFQFQQNGRLQDAELMYKNLLQISPSHIGAKTMLGMLYVQTERAVEGIRLLKSSLIKDPKQFWAHNALGVGLLNTKKFQEAIFSFNKALILKPDYIDSYFNLGKTQRALRQYKDAIVSYSKCIDLDKGYASAYNNIGTIYLEDLKEYEKSVANFQQFVTLVPDSSLGLCNLGAALKELNRYDDALVSYDRAIQLKPDYAEAYYNQGVTFGELKRYDDALVSYDRAIQLKPDYAEAYYNQGVTFGELKRYDDALVSYDRAIQLKPEVDYLLGNVIHTKMHLCDWLNLDILVNQLTEKIMKHEIATMPFIALALIDDPELQKQSAEIRINDKYPISNTLPKISKYPKHQKIRIGYFSADFCNHPVSYLTAELFELHNRDQFEIIAFSFGLNTQDSMRHRLEKGFDKFIDVSEKSDTQITLLAREMEIDIAVDLSGFTRGCRVGIFAMRAAPIQVNYLGYPGTMGAEYIDYIVADPTLIPAEEQCHYSERVVYLPNTYMINDSTLKPSEEQFSRKNFELPENSFIFACFNASYKITPATFSVWMRILGAVDNSVLWLSGMDQTAINNLKNKANECGINIDRIIFASRVPSLSDHLNRIKLADLFLDTFPYNAHTTSNDALRVGLPILTLIGKSFASRVAGSLLNAVGLPELITITQEKYESLAIELATNPEQLEKIKTKLVANLPSSPLCNTKLFAHHIELAYQEMYQFYQAELAPDHIYVKN
jgi:protein O-GlcNAc transferase